MSINLLQDTESRAIPVEVVVRAHKYDGAEHRSWQTHLTRREGSMVILNGVFDSTIDHPQIGRIEAGTVSFEYYWMDHWYSVFCFMKPSGQLLHYYCNINMPPEFDDNVLSYVDLDIDILVTPDLDYSILDEEEFAENSRRFGYPNEVQRHVRAAVAELIEMIETRQFPFTQPANVSQSALPSI